MDTPFEEGSLFSSDAIMGGAQKSSLLNRNDLQRIDAVVFHGIPKSDSDSQLAKIRFMAPNATFVFYLRDPPTYAGGGATIPSKFAGFFDAIASYR